MSSVKNLYETKALDGFSGENGEVVRKGVLRGLISTRECTKTGGQKIQSTNTEQFESYVT